MQTQFKTILAQAFANRPDPSCSVIRVYRGVFYAVTQNSVWVLKWRPLEGRAFWMTDYRKPEGFGDMLLNLACGDGSFPTDDCASGYVVVCEDRGVEAKFWYESLIDACAFATQLGTRPEHGEANVKRIEAFNGSEPVNLEALL